MSAIFVLPYLKWLQILPYLKWSGALEYQVPVAQHSAHIYYVDLLALTNGRAHIAQGAWPGAKPRLERTDTIYPH